MKLNLPLFFFMRQKNKAYRDKMNECLKSNDMSKEQMIEILEDCKEYFENKADADHDGNGFVPNKEMRLSAEITLVIIQLKHNG